MWFEKNKDASVTEPEHWSEVRMQEEGPGLTFEDLEGQPDDVLQGIASLCEVDTELAPGICVPCRAALILAERQQAIIGQSSAGPGESGIPFEDEPEAQVIPEILAMAERVQREDAPVVEQFAAKVRELDVLVQNLLHGPPVPPRNVSLFELSLLTLGSDRWVRMTEAQGVELAPEQKQVLDATKALVARLQA